MCGLWSEVEAFVANYLPADEYAPPPEALRQRLLVEQANAAEYSGDVSTADRLRIQAIQTGPRMDPRSVLEAATALRKRGTTGDIVAFGNTALRPFSVPAKKHVVFAIDLSFDPLKVPARDAMLSILEDSCGPEDMIGLSDLGPEWIFELTKKDGNEAHLINGINSVVGRSSGASLDFTIYTCIEALSHRPSDCGGWLIVLSDMFGASEGARHGDLARAQLTAAHGDVNFVFINSWKTGGYWHGNKPPMESRVVASYIKESAIRHIPPHLAFQARI